MKNSIIYLLTKLNISRLDKKEIQQIYPCKVSFINDLEAMTIISKDQNGKYGLTRLAKLIFKFILEHVVFDKDEILEKLKNFNFSDSAIQWILDWMVELSILKKDNGSEYILINSDEFNDDLEIKSKDDLLTEMKDKIKKSFIGVDGSSKHMTIKAIVKETGISYHVVRECIKDLRKERFIIRSFGFKPAYYELTTPGKIAERSFLNQLSIDYEKEHNQRLNEYIFNSLKLGMSIDAIATVFSLHKNLIQYKIQQLESDGRIEVINTFPTKNMLFFTKEEVKKIRESENQKVLEVFPSCKEVSDMSEKLGFSESKLKKVLNRLVSLNKLTTQRSSDRIIFTLVKQ